MYDRLTEKTKKVLVYARQEAQRMGHQYIGTEHILLGLVREGTGVAAVVLMRLGIESKHVRLEVEKIVKSETDVTPIGKQFPLAPRARKALEYAFEEAKRLGQHGARAAGPAEGGGGRRGSGAPSPRRGD